jgi:hypothetical protein
MTRANGGRGAVKKTIGALLGTVLIASTLAVSATVEAAPLRCGGQVVTIRGDGRANVIRGTKGRDVIHGLGGNDRIYGYGGGDIICGGGGRDRIWGGPGNDRLFGQGGHDGLWGQAGRDALAGSTGDDLVDGGPGKDSASAGKGTDTCLRVVLTRASRCEPTSLARQFEQLSNFNWEGEAEGNWPPVTAEIDGRRYRKSLRDFTNDSYQGPDAQFDLGSRYRRLVATLGLDDDSDERFTARYEVYGDGDLLWEHEFGVGESRTVNLDVTGVLRLRIQVVNHDDPTDSYPAYAAIGSPYVSANPYMRPQR